MPPLTEFQRSCEEALRELLEYRGSRLGRREVVGNGEAFVHASVEGTVTCLASSDQRFLENGFSLNRWGFPDHLQS
jgi:hypothetical protein